MNQKNLQDIANELEFDLEDVQMILNAFLEDSILNLKGIRSAINTKDYERLCLISHAMKGSASNILLHSIVDVVTHIENNANDKNEIDYNQEYNKLEKLIDDLKV